MKKRLLIAITLLIGFSMTFSTPVQAQEVTDLDTMIVARIDEPITVDPVSYDGPSLELVQNVYDTLIRYAVNRTEPDVRKQGKVDQFEPSLATEWTISSDDLTYTFKIREGVKFHNGAILTAEDVEYSFERAMVQHVFSGISPGYPVWMFYESLLDVFNGDPNWPNDDSNPINQTVQSNSTHVWFNLVRPYAPFLSILPEPWSSIINKQWAISQGCWDGNWTTWNDYNDPPISPLDDPEPVMMGTGPYKFDYWTPGVEWSIVKFNDYWQGWPAPGTDGFVSRATVKNISDWSTRKEMFLNGSADIAGVPRLNMTELLNPGTGEPLAGIRSHKDLPRLICRALFFNFDTVVTSPYIGSGALDGNGIPPDFFSDINVRKAFAYSFNYTQLIEDVFLGEAIQPATPVIEGLPYRNPVQAKYYIDLTQATAFFQAATGGATGYPGAVWEKGFNFTITYYELSVTYKKTAEILKSNIESLHPEGKFNIDIIPVNRSRLITEWFWPGGRSINPLFTIGWLADYPDPHNFVRPFMLSHGDLIYPFSYSNATVDALIEEGLTTLNSTRRQEIYYTLQLMYYQDIPTIPTAQGLIRHWERDWVKGWYYNPMQWGEYFYHLWKVNTPAGSDVEVSIPTANVTVTFDNVTDGGITNATASSTGPPEPSGFMLGEPPTYYEINTTATYTDTIEICITYNETQYTDEENLRLLQWNGTAWQDVTVSLDTLNNVICGRVTGFSSFSVMELSRGIAGTVVDEYTGEPIEGVEVSILETSALTFTDEQGVYYFADVEPGNYTVEMTVPYGYLTHDAVTKFVELPPETVMKVDFTLYQASWADATVPRTIGYWKNWDKHYTLELMATYIEHVKAASGLFSDLTVEDVESYFKITRHSSMEEKGQAQLLASWLNVVSAQLGVDVQVDLTSISGWETVIADDDGVLTVDELLRQIDNFYATDATLTKDEWETIKKILDSLNNGRLFIT